MENWVFLVYRVPREPSTPRISVWRKLKRLGVAQVGDGLVALPYDASTKERLEWIAHDITEAGGDATIWITTPSIRRFGRSLAESLASERAGEYREVCAQVAASVGLGQVDRSRALRRLRAEYRRIERRDYFPPAEKADAREALDRLASGLEPAVIP
jgi:hypothetical protein